MNKFDLKQLGVKEMSTEELISVEGGNIFREAWNAIQRAGRWFVQSFMNAL